MTIIYEDLDKPDDTGPWPAEVRIRLAGAQGRPVLGRKISTGGTIVGETLLSTANGGIDASGVWALDLWPTSDISPGGTTWRIERRIPDCQEFVTYVTAPITGGPYEASTREDDPLGEITPSALASHAADLALHGGGIEIAFQKISTSVIVTGSSGGLVATAVPGLVITVPDLARPIYLHGHIPAIQPVGGPAEANAGIYIQGSTGVFASLDSVPIPDMDTATARTVDLWARLPAHSPNNFVVAGTGASGNLTMKINASLVTLAFLRAIAA